MVGVYNDKEYKLIPNPACLHFFKSKAPDESLKKNLFVYQHVESRKFMLAKWIGGDVFFPVLELGKEPLLNDDIVNAFFNYCHPQAAETVRQGLVKAKNNQLTNSEELENDKRTMRAQILRDEFKIKVSDEDGTAYLPTGLVGSENC